MAKDIKKENLEIRPPIIVVMGHIDHGKTTLLDFIRKTKVTEGEAGGITQHVAAYEIESNPSTSSGPSGKITFIDTPGHEAFTNIRRRGAKIADIAILIIAADDKVNNQTIESIEAIKEADMPFIVAINKIDRENANSEKIKKELSEREIFVEEWGGKIPCIEISALTGKGVDDLLDMINLMAEMEELKANPKEKATGSVLESHVEGKRGIAATLLIQNGTLKKGMHIVSEDSLSPVRIFEDFSGKTIAEAGPSSPVKIVGFNKAPKSGAEFVSFEKKKEAEKATTSPIKPEVEEKEKQEETPEAEEFTGERAIIPIIIKTDVAGSTEAVLKQLKKIETPKIGFNILRSDAGDINEDDVKLASSGEKTLIVGFNVKASSNISLLAERMGVEIKLFNIIYEAEDWLKEEAKKREPVEEVEEVVGEAKILKIFRDEKAKKIIGAEATSGKILTGKKVNIFRKDFKLGEGQILELKRQQTKVEEIKEGEQFGALIQTKANIEPKDKIEVIEKIIR